MRRNRSSSLVAAAIAALLAGCGPGTEQPQAAPWALAPLQPASGAGSVVSSAAVLMQQVVPRWNAVAAQLPVDLPAPFGHVTFAWDGEHFPHPTFKGGSDQAYGAFAKVLLAFMQSDGTFDLLAANHLFTVTLRSGVAGPQGPDAGWTFAELVTTFAQPDAYGDHDAATRAALAAFAQRISGAAVAAAAPGSGRGPALPVRVREGRTFSPSPSGRGQG